jgi:hypothetical protein
MSAILHLLRRCSYYITNFNQYGTLPFVFVVDKRATIVIKLLISGESSPWKKKPEKQASVL